MVKLVIIKIAGTPIPQGSKSVTRTGLMYEANRNLKEWRKKAQEAAEEFRGAFEKDEPVYIFETYVFERPQSAPPHKRAHMSVKPDLDKLERATGDAISKAGVWGDDARVVARASRKLYTDEAGLEPGAYIEISDTHNRIHTLNIPVIPCREKIYSWNDPPATCRLDDGHEGEHDFKIRGNKK